MAVAGLSSRASLLFREYQMRQGEIDRLSRTIRRRYSEAYKAAITAELRRLGYDQQGNNPGGSELAEIRRLVDRDVSSIVETFHRELRQQIDRLVAAYPDWPPQQFKTTLDNWQSQRATWKTQQIIDASRANGGEYARRRFFEENDFTDDLFTWDASPPIVANSHWECIRRVQRGLVDWQEAQGWQRVHPNCRHRVRPAVLYGHDLSHLWRG